MKGLQPRQADILDPNNFAFMIVRHPLDRLISAFTDRILNHKTPQVVLKHFGLWNSNHFRQRSIYQRYWITQQIQLTQQVPNSANFSATLQVFSKQTKNIFDSDIWFDLWRWRRWFSLVPIPSWLQSLSRSLWLDCQVWGWQHGHSGEIGTSKVSKNQLAFNANSNFLGLVWTSMSTLKQNEDRPLQPARRGNFSKTLVVKQSRRSKRFMTLTLNCFSILQMTTYCLKILTVNKRSNFTW